MRQSRTLRTRRPVTKLRTRRSVMRTSESSAEFCAVATEVFFTRPVPLREENPALYGVLRDYFGQDPASFD